MSSDPHPQLPEEGERLYLVRCGHCSFIAEASLGHCPKCGYDGMDPPSEGFDVVRVEEEPPEQCFCPKCYTPIKWKTLSGSVEEGVEEQDD